MFHFLLADRWRLFTAIGQPNKVEMYMIVDVDSVQEGSDLVIKELDKHYFVLQILTN